MAERQQRSRSTARGSVGRVRPRPSLSDALIEAVTADFVAHGATAIAKMREDKPDLYLKIVLGVLPKELTDEACSTAELRIIERRIVHAAD